MKFSFFIFLSASIIFAGGIVMNKNLTDFEKFVLFQKGTEPPFSGEYVDFYKKGVYKCKNCGEKLFESDAKFHSRTGWPSFDDAIEGAVKKVPDPDGMRMEIVCAHCGAHLGHLFEGEGYTDKNMRYCVNSVSLQFEASEN